eukprot:scaffold261_cov336-Pavlova_lutheri.AAC.87
MPEKMGMSDVCFDYTSREWGQDIQWRRALARQGASSNTPKIDLNPRSYQNKRRSGAGTWRLFILYGSK